MPQGVPSGMNMISSPPTSGFTVVRLTYFGFSPFAFTNGTISYTNSMVDWIHTNSNYTQWSFNVKPGLMWSNGQPVTANDIVNTYGPQFGLNASFDVYNLRLEIKSVTALNSSTAVFVLNKPDAHFQEFAGQNQYTVVYPESFISQGPGFDGITFANGSASTTLVGDGPFYPVNYHSGDTQMEFLRNPYYKPLPTVCELIMSFVETDSQDPTYLLGGAADFGIIEPGVVGSLAQNPNVHLFDEHSTFNEFLSYNATVYPYSNLAFRQALAYGINFSQIAQQAYNGYAGVSTSAQGGVPPASAGLYNPNQPTYTYNPTKSLSLLNSMGIKKGSDGYLQYSNGTDITLTIWADNSYTGETLSSGIVSSNLGSLGFKINAQALSMGTLIGDSYSGVTRGGMILFQSGGTVFGYPYLDAVGPLVYSAYAPYPVWEPDPTQAAEYNSNVSAMKVTANPALEKQYLNNIQSINAQDLPNLMLAFPDDLYAYSTQHLTNWPSFVIYGLNAAFNDLGFSQLTPISATTSSVVTSTSPTTTSMVTTTSTSMTSSTSSSSNNIYLYAGVVVVVIVVIAIAALATRRRGPQPASPAPATPPSG